MAATVAAARRCLEWQAAAGRRQRAPWRSESQPRQAPQAHMCGCCLDRCPSLRLSCMHVIYFASAAARSVRATPS